MIPLILGAAALAVQASEPPHAVCPEHAARVAIPACIQAPAEGGPVWPDEPWGMMAPVDESFVAAACFDPNDPPSLEVQQAVDQIMRGMLFDRFVLNTSWPGADNTPIALTWSFVPDGTSIPGSSSVGEPTSNSSLFSTMNSRFGAIHQDVWIAQFQSCFDRWAALTGTSYTRVRNNGNEWDDGAAFPTSAGSNTPGATRGDIRIACHPIDGNGRVLAYNYYPSGGDMVLDSGETWNFGAPNYVFLRNCVTHEHGHGLGLSHVCPANSTKLMEPYIVETFDGPQHDDIRAVQYLYGDAYEPNNSRLAATNLGGLGLGATLNPSTPAGPAVTNASLTGISLTGDEDWFLFTTTAPMFGVISVAPIGSAYADYTQDAACGNAVVNTNSLNQADLILELYNSSGILLNSSNTGGFGATESLSNVLLSPPGNLYVRVRANNTPTEPQLYTLTIGAPTAPTFTVSDGTFTDRIRLNWSAVTGALSYTIFKSTTNNRATATQYSTAQSGTLQFDDFAVSAATTYYYWIEATTNAGGSRPLGGPDSGFLGSVNAPANDVCGNAVTVAKGSVIAGTLLNATADSAAISCGPAGPDVWYSFTASCAGTFNVSTCGTSDTGGLDAGMDSVLSLWSGCPSSGGVELACNDNAAAGECVALDGGNVRDAFVSRAMSAGENVRIRVSKTTASAAGPFTLRVGFNVLGDSCASPVPITPGPPVSFCTTLAGTDGPAESGCFSAADPQIANDLWFVYTPVGDGPWTVRTCGSSFDTRMAAYTACPGGSGQALGCNDNSNACAAGSTQSSLTVLGVAQTPYLIRVGGGGGASGPGQIRVYCPSDVNFSGDVSLQDIFDYLTLYFSSDPAADFNGSGTQTVQDLFDFLAAWFGGC